MSIYKISKGLELIREEPFKLEKEMQTLTETNLKSLFNLEFVATELTMGDFRFDTLAFDIESKAFVIIEFKKDKNFSVIDQGYAYLSLMLNNKADFILEYNEHMNKSLKRDDIDWSQTRVMFISQSFTTYQKEATNFQDIPIELWEMKRYENQTVSFELIKKASTKATIKTISKKSKVIEDVSKEIIVYTEQKLLEVADDEVKELYETLQNSIINLLGIKLRPLKTRIAFVDSINVSVLHMFIKKDSIRIWLNLPKGELIDNNNIAELLGDGYYFNVHPGDDLEYIMSLVNQSYKRNRKQK
jgi:predicted transport protein